ncbi:glutathione S-transferase family protein [Paraburkholderia flava]|uniref:glutathione S-transferase family protein n=1 Tax=Paraburkholderia flava TaxID=2547393 RepID=UPI00105FDE95|nr:glutathione S-transferase [Paraburkholderia flava]
MAEFKLHCFAQSGNAYKAALMMSCAGADWEPVFVDFFSGVTRTDAWRDTVNEMGEVPVLEHRGAMLAQSGVILDYLAEQLGVYGGRDAQERREILRWILFDNHKFSSYFVTHRWLRSFAQEPPSPDVIAFLRARIDAAFQVVDRHLATRSWMVNDRLSIADFSLIGYLYFPVDETGYDLANTHPHIAAWRDRMAAQPGWKHPYDMLPGTILKPRHTTTDS